MSAQISPESSSSLVRGLERAWDDGIPYLLRASDVIVALNAIRGVASMTAPTSREKLPVCCYCDAELSCAQCGMEQPGPAQSPPTLAQDEILAACDWPNKPFTFFDEPGEHDPCYVVMPCGAMLSLNHNAHEGVDVARAKFIINACNTALAPPKYQPSVDFSSPEEAEDYESSVSSTVQREETDEQLDERLAKQEARDNLRLLDHIAHKIGLPLDQELSRENFGAWWASVTSKGPAMSDRIFYQSHECEGFRAKVTIEWTMPVDGDLLPAWRKEVAEEIADSILAFSGKKMRDMVQALRGFTPHPLHHQRGSND